MRYIHYDENTGRVLGYYNDKIHKNIPTPSDEITLEKMRTQKFAFYDKHTKEFFERPEDTLKHKVESFKRTVKRELEKTDKYMISDFPITETEKAAVIQYRHNLRQATSMEELPALAYTD